jgi:hypothetical protein
MWAHVSDDLWVASLGSVHLGRVEQQGEHYVAIDHVNTTIGSFPTNLRARQAVADRTDAAVEYSMAGGPLIVPEVRGNHRAMVIVAVVVAVVLVIATAATVAWFTLAP